MIERIDYFITLSILLIKQLTCESVDNVIAFFIIASNCIQKNQIVLSHICEFNINTVRRSALIPKF